MKYVLGIFIIWLHLSCSNVENSKHTFSDNKNDIQANHLISIDSFLILQEKADVRILQVSKLEEYNKAHIPNAYPIWRPDYGNYTNPNISGMRPSHSQLQNLLRKINVPDDTKLILYDHKGNADAFRFAWVLELSGFDNYYILNGGLEFWKENNLPISNIPAPFPDSSNFQLERISELSSLATFDDVLAAMNDPNSIIIDTRELHEYFGEPFVQKNKLYRFKKGAFINGHIPNAIHLNWSQLTDLNGDHRIKSMKDLHYDLEQAGISPDKKIIVYCQSGSRSSHTSFVFREVLKYPHVKNYDGSWIEWSYRHSIDSSIPIMQKTDSTEFNILYNRLLKEIEELDLES